MSASGFTDMASELLPAAGPFAADLVVSTEPIIVSPSYRFERFCQTVALVCSIKAITANSLLIN